MLASIVFNPLPQWICAVSAIASATLLGPISLWICCMYASANPLFPQELESTAPSWDNQPWQSALPMNGHTLRVFHEFFPNNIQHLSAPSWGYLLLPSPRTIEYSAEDILFSFPNHIFCITHTHNNSLISVSDNKLNYTNFVESNVFFLSRPDLHETIWPFSIKR